jgi:hypothetical protein
MASRNALRHGFAAARHRVPVAKADLERFAIALCGRTDDHALFQQALIIAENELVLRAINQQQLAVIERLRDPSVPAFSQRDNSLQLMRARFRKSKQAEKAIKALREALLEKYDHRLPPSSAEHAQTELDALFPSHLEELLEKLEKKQRRAAPSSKILNFQDANRFYERDEGRALETAIKDLIRLDRYERRASSRQRRAIFAFINLKVSERLQSSEAGRLPN